MIRRVVNWVLVAAVIGLAASTAVLWFTPDTTGNHSLIMGAAWVSLVAFLALMVSLVVQLGYIVVDRLRQLAADAEQRRGRP
ncbi:hypothetical protein AB0M43_38215 [Longispora sp. NPDC051575]|uniref:hypothetical protein n=1 Tax=Longispora sp. NPDC051575 TaxID=3154943 RepID=UPI00342F2921